MKEISRWLGETAKPQSKTPACVTTIEASDAVPLETVIVALRDELPAFSATVKVKVSLSGSVTSMVPVTTPVGPWPVWLPDWVGVWLNSRVAIGLDPVASAVDAAVGQSRRSH